MEIGVERPVEKSYVDLVLDDVELFFVSFWSDFTEALGYFGFAQSNYSFVLEVAAKWHFDESLVRSNSQNSIIVIKLPLEKLISVLVVINRGVFGVAGACIFIKVVQDNNDSLAIIGEEWRFDLYGEIFSSVLVQCQLVYYFAHYVEATVNKLFVDLQLVGALCENLVPFSAV